MTTDVEVQVECPECASTVAFTLKDVACQRTVRCAAGHTIRLKDDGGGADQVVRAFDRFDRTLKDLGK